jgi:hypothetical protein
MFTGAPQPPKVPPQILKSLPPLSPAQKLAKLTGKAKSSGKAFLVFVIILVVIFIFALPIVYVMTNMKKIRKNWPKYRCSPAVMPFAGIINKSVSTGKNFEFCIGNMMNGAISKGTDPQNQSIGKITGILTSFNTDIQNIRKTFSNIRNSIVNQVHNIQEKVYKAYERIAYIFKLIIKVLVRLMITFKNIFNLAKYAFWTLASLWNGPIGGFIRFFCFGGETLITLKDGRHIPIREISINDKLANDTYVTGILEFNTGNTQMFDYKGINVSGNHYVFENNKYIKVADSIFGKEIDYKCNRIYCLLTNSGEITIQNIKFTDFSVVKNIELYTSLIKQVSMDKDIELNLGEDFNSFYSGFTLDSQIGNKKAKDINIGDIINGNKIVGKVFFISNERIIYKIPGENSYLLENGFIKINNKWECINKLNLEKEYSGSNIYVNFVTNNGVIKVGNYTILDFEIADTNNLSEMHEIIIDEKINLL